MTQAVDVNVTGFVQGVFFRAEAQQEAYRLGVAGWVRNQPDGSVAAHFEGEPRAVDGDGRVVHQRPEAGPGRGRRRAATPPPSSATGFDVD